MPQSPPTHEDEPFVVQVGNVESKEEVLHFSDVSSLSSVSEGGESVDDALAQSLDRDEPVSEEKVQDRGDGQSRGRLALWMTVNTLATIGIAQVFINKHIFDLEAFRHAQTSFAAYHFFLSGAALYVVSRPKFGLFVPQRVPIRAMAPLALALALNVILPNTSLAFSSVTFYQISRILLTPTVVIINFVLYGTKISRAAALALVPACLGVAMVTYYDSRGNPNLKAKPTSPTGVFFAFAGVLASSVYTVWVASYLKRLQLASMQLLFNLMPVGGCLLLYVIPFTDTLPTWSDLTLGRCILVLMSGLCACLINISQFFIISGAGPVSSTVVGHLKTCSIVALGWIASGRAVNDKGIFGILLALGGMISYSHIMMNTKK
ncbi:MAG: hypothetical protein M1838_004692 [Thelocarpon superellum]|nr:MAG: hypothetical protein M1838_004692 [Thelocarpon superellum]